MRLTTVISGAAALFFVSAPAFAADPLPPPPPQVAAMEVHEEPAQTWTGGYVGGHAGIGRGLLGNGGVCYDEGENDYPIYFQVGWPSQTLNTVDPYCYDTFVGAIYTGEETPFGIAEATGIAGYLAGAQIGFNLQLGQGKVGFVIGAEVSTSVSSLSAALQGYFEFYCYEFGWNSEFRINQLTTATVRAGLAFGPVLLYGEGGLALVNATWVNTIGFSDTATDHGYVYGGGIEFRVNPNISLFAEYNRVVIPHHEFLGSVDPFVLPLPTAINVSSATNIVKVGFNIAIGRYH